MSDRIARGPGLGARLSLAVLGLCCAPAAVPRLAAPSVAAAPEEPSVSVPGRDLPLHSSGAAEGPSWVLRDNGFVGVFVRVASEGRVTLRVTASGQDDKAAEPQLRIAIADQKQQELVHSQPRAYAWSGQLRPGTYLLRVDYFNHTPGSARQLSVQGLSVSGASVLPDASDRNALDAANTFIQNYRRFPVRIRVAGVAPGHPVHVRLERHAFGFGVNIPGADNRMLTEAPAPGSEAARFQQMVLENFNTVVLSNGGKWIYHEQERDQVKLDYVDRFLFFARDNGLRARMHTLLWDTQQQPAWVVSEDAKKPGLLTLAQRGDEQAKTDLEQQISERVQYLVRQRAAAYDELDVLNESLHRSRYWQTFGAEGVAQIFNEAAAAVQAAGANTKLFLNEYNLLQFSADPASQAPDPYANWYRWHAEQLERAGAKLDGLGVQYYADGRGEAELGDGVHSAARIFEVLQNLSGTGLGLTLTEFTVNGREGVTPERGADILEETLRLVFGTPAAHTALIWSVWAGASQTPTPPSVLFDQDFKLTPAGERYRRLMAEWSPDVTVRVPDSGEIELDAFAGEYSVESGGKLGCFAAHEAGAYGVALADPAGIKRIGGRPCLQPRPLLALGALPHRMASEAAERVRGRAGPACGP
jgi:GH35 family endo-1,4-beta-xylanase